MRRDRGLEADPLGYPAIEAARERFLSARGRLDWATAHNEDASTITAELPGLATAYRQSLATTKEAEQQAMLEARAAAITQLSLAVDSGAAAHVTLPPVDLIGWEPFELEVADETAGW